MIGPVEEGANRLLLYLKGFLDFVVCRLDVCSTFSLKEIKSLIQKGLASSLASGYSLEMNPIIKKYPRLLLILGFVGTLIPVVFYLAGCILSEGRCSGDSMGGVMMVYGIVLFIPNVIVLIGLICVNALVLKVNFKKISKLEKSCYYLFFLMVIFVIFMEKPLDWVFGEIYGFNVESTIDVNNFGPKSR